MATINHGDRVPILEHTNSDAFFSYCVYKLKDPRYPGFNFLCLKWKIDKAGLSRVNEFALLFTEFEKFHNQVIAQGFVPMPPFHNDDPDVVMTYI